MNERIKELAEQANKYALGNWTDTYNNLYNEKFAELIIRECQHTVDRYIGECCEISSLPEKVLKKHFGIE